MRSSQSSLRQELRLHSVGQRRIDWSFVHQSEDDHDIVFVRLLGTSDRPNADGLLIKLRKQITITIEPICTDATANELLSNDMLISEDIL